MSVICAFDHKNWAESGFLDYGDFSDMVEYVNQQEDGPDSYRGHWWYGDDEARVLYFGSFGNYNSPGASSHTYAERFDAEEDYRAAVAEWERLPEYLEVEVEEVDHVERLTRLAVDKGFMSSGLAVLLNIDPDRLNNGGLMEVIELALEDDDPEWIEEMINSDPDGDEERKKTFDFYMRGPQC